MLSNSFRFFAILFSLMTILFLSESFGKVTAQQADSLVNVAYLDLYKMGRSDVDDLNTELNKELIKHSDNLKLNLLRAKIYLYEKNYKAAEGLLKRLTKVFPQSGEVNYFLSRLYTEMDSLTLSYTYMYRINASAQYDSGFLKELENDALPFYNRFEKEVYNNSENKVEYILMTWMRKDPYPASVENEYFDQMIKRLDYVYENFNDGFSYDDRGRIYLKYGEPTLRREFAHQGYRTECWVYRNIAKNEVTFDFIKSFKNPRWTEIRFKSDIPGDSFINDKYTGNFEDTEPSKTFFEDRNMISSKYQNAYAQLQALAIDSDISQGPATTPFEKEDYFIINYFNQDKENKAKLPEVVAAIPVPTIPLSVEYCRFKHDSSSVNLETYIGIPIKDINNAVDGKLNKRIVFNEKLSIKDRTLFPVATHSDKIEFTYDNVNTAHFIDMLTFTVPQDKFVISYEVDDEAKRFISSKVLQVDVSNFIQKDLFLSDIQLSIGVKENVGPGKYTKNGLFIQPYPYAMFSKNAPVFIYFEIYNLVKSHSLTNYDISYGLAKSYEKNILEKIFTMDFSDKPGYIQFNQNYNGDKTDDFIYFQLNVSNLDIGEYVLKVKVTDKNSGKSFVRERKFFLTI